MEQDENKEAMNSNPTQESQILAHLKEGKPITQMDALTLFGCFRLASRINQLRNQGYAIDTERLELPNKKHVARYWLRQGQMKLAV